VSQLLRFRAGAQIEMRPPSDLAAMLGAEHHRRKSGDGCARLSRVSPHRGPSEDLCHVLKEDADLLSAVTAERRQQAAEECIARCVRVPPGPWKGDGTEEIRDGLGLLVLDGLLLRRVGVDGRYGAELLGESDILRPWQGEGTEPVLPRTTGWVVLSGTRFAVLDAVATRRIARYPDLIGPLVGRALDRSRNLTINMAIIHHPRIDTRLHMLFWHLADRWGRVRGDGTVLPIQLTHRYLAELVAASRPTVTAALAELSARGLVSSVEVGWLLSGQPPGELLEVEVRHAA